MGRAGRALIEAAGGAEGLEKFEDEKPDLTLLDVKMPRMDGIETLLRIRLLGKEAKVAMLTAVVDTGLEQIARERGALDFIHEQSGIDVSLATVAKIVQGSSRV